MFITLLLLSCVCALSTGRHSRHAVKPFQCCEKVTSFDLTNEVIGRHYEPHTANGNCVEVIILHTHGGKVCADPNAEWVKKIISNMTVGKV